MYHQKSSDISSHYSTANYSSFFHIDSGSNVNIVNDRSYFDSFKPIQSPLTDVNEAKNPIQGRSPIIFKFGTIFLPLHNFLYMPNHKYCLISTVAIKILDGFMKADHDIGKSFIVKQCREGRITLHLYRYMYWRNGMDYLPLITTIHHVTPNPSSSVDITTKVTTRSGSNVKKTANVLANEDTEIYLDIKLPPKRKKTTHY